MPDSAPPNILDALVRSVAGGATFGAANNVAAAGDAAIPLDSGSSTAPTWQQRYTQNLANQTEQDRLGQQQHGAMYSVGNLAGQALNPLWRFFPSVGTALEAKANLPLMFTQQQADNRGAGQERGNAQRATPSLLDLLTNFGSN